MKVNTSTVTKIYITDADKLDPVTVYAEDVGARKGKITIECYGESWSAYWDGMGNNTIADFFCSCDEHYIAGKLSSIRADVPDYDGLADKAKSEIIKLRKELDIDKTEARQLFDGADNFNGDLLSDNEQQKTMSEIFGDEWWYSIPDKPNHRYQYLCRIILAVQTAFKQIAPNKIAA